MATTHVTLAPPCQFPTWRCYRCRAVQFKKPGRLRCLRCKAPLNPFLAAPATLFTPADQAPIFRRFARIRQLKGISQGDAARRMGTQRTYISKFEIGGVQSPLVTQMLRMAEAIGVSMFELCGWDSEVAIAKRTIAQGGTSSEIMMAVLEIWPELDDWARCELLRIFEDFQKGQLHITDYTRIESCHSKKARAPQLSTTTSTK